MKEFLVCLKYKTTLRNDLLVITFHMDSFPMDLEYGGGHTTLCMEE
jgi:hypothetical protein